MRAITRTLCNITFQAVFTPKLSITPKLLSSCRITAAAAVAAMAVHLVAMVALREAMAAVVSAAASVVRPQRGAMATGSAPRAMPTTLRHAASVSSAVWRNVRVERAGGPRAPPGCAPKHLLCAVVCLAQAAFACFCVSRGDGGLMRGASLLLMASFHGFAWSG